MELAGASGLKVLHAMVEDDRTAICGPRSQHQAQRSGSRAGTVPSEVVLGGRKVEIRRPRVLAEGEEVALPTFRAFADTDPLNHRVVEQMLVGVDRWSVNLCASAGRVRPIGASDDTATVPTSFAVAKS